MVAYRYGLEYPIDDDELVGTGSFLECQTNSIVL